MPLPHEQAAIDRAQGRQRERLVDAAAVLDRVRREYPGIDDPRQLPPEVRGEVFRALLAFRPGAGFGAAELVLALLLAVGLFLTWFEPVRVFRCTPQGDGLAQCLVSDRLFGLWPIRDRTVAGIAKTALERRAITSQSKDSSGRSKTTTMREDELTLLDAQGRALWSASASFVLGASLDQMGTELDQLASGQMTGPILRLQAVWPALLAASLFVLIGLSGLASKVGLALRNRGFIPQGVYNIVFAWGGFLVPVVLYGAAWILVLLGKSPPAALAGILGLGAR